MQKLPHSFITLCLVLICSTQAIAQNGATSPQPEILPKTTYLAHGTVDRLVDGEPMDEPAQVSITYNSSSKVVSMGWDDSSEPFLLRNIEYISQENSRDYRILHFRKGDLKMKVSASLPRNASSLDHLLSPPGTPRPPANSALLNLDFEGEFYSGRVMTAFTKFGQLPKEILLDYDYRAYTTAKLTENELIGGVTILWDQSKLLHDPANGGFDKFIYLLKVRSPLHFTGDLSRKLNEADARIETIFPEPTAELSPRIGAGN